MKDEYEKRNNKEKYGDITAQCGNGNPVENN